MKSWFSARYCLVIVAVIALAGIAHQAQAVTLIPPSFEFSDVKPGEKIPTKVKVLNNEDEAVTLYSETAVFTPLDETGTPNIIPNSSTEDVAGWMKIAPGPFILQPGERLEVPVEINVPLDADPGGHYGAVLFAANPPSATTEGSQVAIASKIAALVLVRVQGEVNESGTVADFSTADGKTSYNRLPIGFSLRFENTGNVHIRPTGQITIRNMLGGTSTVVPVNSQKGAVLPSSTRKFTDALVWEKRPQSEAKGNFFQEIGSEWRNFALGPYTANVILTYGQNNDKTTSATVNFWVMPWRVLILTLIVLILIIWLIGKLIRHYNQWIISRASNPQAPRK